jgi:hypothetical protein
MHLTLIIRVTVYYIKSQNHNNFIYVNEKHSEIQYLINLFPLFNILNAICKINENEFNSMLFF